MRTGIVPRKGQEGIPIMARNSANDRRLAANSPVNRAARGLAPLPPAPARGRNSAATVAAPATPDYNGPRVEFAFGTAGRPDAARIAAVAAAFDLLADAVARMAAPKATVPPRNASPRVRAAFAADDAARMAAFDLLRTAVANGRGRSN